MALEPKKTAIENIIDLSWGTHVCYFYETKQDLLDTLALYFKAGLEGNEFCLWVISESLTREEAIDALRKVVPNLDRYLANGSLEIRSYDEWYREEGVLDLNKVRSGCDEKLNEALARGYAGLRLTGDASWISDREWRSFQEYEKGLSDLVANKRMVIFCTYQLATTRAGEVFDVARAHQFAIATRRGSWEIVETPELKQTKAEIERLNDELEQTVAERTRELAATNDALNEEITERKRAEEELLLLAAIVESSDDAINSQTLDGRITSWNASAERMFDYRAAEAVGRHISFITPPERVDEQTMILERLQRGERVKHLQTVRVRKDGVRVDVAVSISPVKDARGRIVGASTIAHDITERKQVEQRLREYEKVVEGLDEMIVVADRDYRYLLANRAFLKNRGLEREQLLGRLVPEFLTPGVFENVVKRKLDECFAGNVVKYEMRYDYPTLGERDLFISYFPIEGPTGIDRVACVLKDVTEAKRAEEQLKATSEQLRALSASLQSAREEEATRIAREIHDELGAALSSLRWDLEDVDEAISKSGDQAQLQELRKKIEAMMTLTDTTINAVRRIGSELRPIALDALGLIEAIEWQARQFQDRTGIIVQFDCTLENVDLSREQSTVVFRIFQEVLTNILRHAQGTRVNIQMNEEDGEFILTISDDGRGITDDEKSGQRTLGLLGMRERAHLIGGKVDITGSDGKGTVVTVRIPISR